MPLIKPLIARLLHERAMGCERKERPDQAEALYRRALSLDPNRSATWFNLGLLCKHQGRWAESREFNQKALALDPKDDAARWNLGIAATALGDWATARRAWTSYGISIPEGEGPIQADFGLVPVRLDPKGHGEVVWARRIDPARGVIESIPFPDSGFGYGDTVLHDGAPSGYRMLNGQEVPVFDVLALLEPSPWSTYVAEVTAESTDDVAALQEQGLPLEDWTASVRALCRACSEGRPHGHPEHDHLPVSEWKPTRRFGIAAQSAQAVTTMLAIWAGSGFGKVISVTCTLNRNAAT